MSEAPLDASATSVRHTRVIVIGCAVVLLVTAVLVGIADNPPGMLLAFASAICVVLALTTGWHHPRKNYYLFIGSFLAFAVTAILHNVFEGLAMLTAVP